MTMTKPMLESLDPDQAEAAARLLDVALRKGCSRIQLRDALPTGLEWALYHGHWSTWGNVTSALAINAAGRLLCRLAHELALPLTSPSGTTAVGVATELLS